jgi:hypothetical protein
MNKRWHGLLVAGAVLLLANSARAARPENPGNGNGGGPAACDEAAVAAAQASIDAACPCAGKTDDTGAVVPWKNHGQYVRCIAKATKAAIKDSDGALSRHCLRSSVRCAARSTCGKREGTVNCTTTTSSACVAGACADGDACTSDAVCTESSCSFRPSADLCTASGGTPGTGSCCAPVPVGSPSGAVVDGGAFF